MKRIDECMDMTVLVALLVVGILLVMGAYRIFSFLCEHAALDARTFLLGAACLLLAVVGLLLTYYLTSVGSYGTLSPLYMLAFLALWLLPTLLLSGLAKRF